MTAIRQLSDIEINAFADGELSGEAKESVRLALESDEAGRATAAWRDVLGEKLHHAFDPGLLEPLPAQTARILRPNHVWTVPRGASSAIPVAPAMPPPTLRADHGPARRPWAVGPLGRAWRECQRATAVVVSAG